MQRKILGLFAIIILMGIGIFGFVRYRQYRISELQKSLELEIEYLINNYKKRLSNVSQTDMDKLAIKHHIEEFHKRLSYDPQFAYTSREKTILKMISISHDKTLSNDHILIEVATLASPKNSKVEISKLGECYIVNVAFDMAVMTYGEYGAYTKHSTKASLKQEVITLISRVMKDLYDHCGTRTIEKIVVACEHGVIYKRYPVLPGVNHQTKTFQMTVIYKCSISKTQALKVANWREAKLHQVSSMLKVDNDMFPYLNIQTN
ncbi:MAG: hypothetical protein ISS16_11440 [Ignavibacteria bacterium]|nr:hypothetical protein [Ignavibacteria bacterium]